MREARSKLRLIKPEDMDMDEYLVLSNSWAYLGVTLSWGFNLSHFCDNLSGNESVDAVSSRAA